MAVCLRPRLLTTEAKTRLHLSKPIPKRQRGRAPRWGIPHSVQLQAPLGLTCHKWGPYPHVCSCADIRAPECSSSARDGRGLSHRPLDWGEAGVFSPGNRPAKLGQITPKAKVDPYLRWKDVSRCHHWWLRISRGRRIHSTEPSAWIGLALNTSFSWNLCV